MCGGGGLKTATRSLHPKIALVLFRLMAHVNNTVVARILKVTTIVSSLAMSREASIVRFSKYEYML